MQTLCLILAVLTSLTGLVLIAFSFDYQEIGFGVSIMGVLLAVIACLVEANNNNKKMKQWKK